jgi:hypothetical protein
MCFAHLHGQQYILPILLLLAAVFIGIPAIIGLLYYRFRGRQRRPIQKQDSILRG